MSSDGTPDNSQTASEELKITIDEATEEFNKIMLLPPHPPKSSKPPPHPPKSSKPPQPPERITFNEMMQEERSGENSPIDWVDRRPQIPRRTETLTREDTIIREEKRSDILNTYKCGEKSIDKRLLSLIIKFIISIYVLTFCSIKLSSSCENTEIYVIFFSLTIGFYLNTGVETIENVLLKK